MKYHYTHVCVVVDQGTRITITWYDANENAICTEDAVVTGSSEAIENYVPSLASRIKNSHMERFYQGDAENEVTD